MKFVIAVVIVALTACAQGSAITPLVYSYAPAPLIARPLDGTYTERQFAPRLTYAAPLSYHYPAAYSAPLAYAAPTYASYAAPAQFAYAAAPAIVARELAPTYTAANRGAVHVASLPGHSESTSAVNLEAAPGTL